ncbi:MAG TPA: HAD hydrolase-like protein [Candidatus Binatia bacterium]|jgi:phosphoglycolate phosphatase-like HAD superfamily hydrolase
MGVILFDVDGTLTDTMDVDTRCFLQAFVDVCGFADVDPDWSHYRNATDAGIFQEVFESRRGRSPTVSETVEFREHLVALFRSAAQQKPFAPIRGASALLRRLSERGEYRIGLATGCWSDAARVKMASAGFCYDDYPSASADDAPDRETIVRIAAQRTAGETDREWNRAIYVGDGVWDVKMSRLLGIPFLGIGSEEQRESLIAAGASDVLPDFSDIHGFLLSLHKLARG